MEEKELKEVCSRCGEADTSLDIAKCPICFKLACRHCSVKISGRSFCSQICANYFFHGDDDGSGGQDDE